MSIYRIVDFFILCRLCFLCYYYFICHFFLFIILHFGLHQHQHQITADKRGKRLKIFPYGWKKSDMVGKLLWMEGDKFRYAWKKSDMVGKLLRIQGGNDWKYSHMVGKSLTWSENYSGWKATISNMVGNFPQGVRKGVPSHRKFSLVHPSYRREFPILFSISVPIAI